MKQNKSFLTALLVALLAVLPLAGTAQTEQLAKWTFDTGYTVADNVYTPNGDAWAQIGWNGFGTLPRILPNEFSGSQTDYYVSAKGTRFWGIMENYDTKIMSLYQDMDPNNISDYTDAAQHNQYFEIGFPTKGYKNIQFSFALPVVTIRSAVWKWWSLLTVDRHGAMQVPMPVLPTGGFTIPVRSHCRPTTRNTSSSD